MTVRVNLLCIAGVLLGVVSLFFPWVTSGSHFGGDDDLLVQGIMMPSLQFEFAMVLSASFFVLGTFLALLSPSGGFAQLGGALGVIFLAPSEYAPAWGDYAFSLGAYIGIVSALIVTVSFFVPMGIGYEVLKRETKGGVDWPSHLLTVCPLKTSAKLRINVLCLLGAILGFVSMALPWMLETEGGTMIHYHVEFNLYYHLDSNIEVAALTAFLIGTCAAFLTPLGGILQMVGVIWFAASRSDDIVTLHFRKQ